MEKELQKPGQQNYKLRLHCSYLCNQSCSYCHVFKGGQEIPKTHRLMDITVASQAMDAYARLMQGQESANITISFYGGEPLLNWRMVRSALGYGNQTFTGKKHVHWILNTNGTLISPDIANLLKQANVDVHISIDGPDEDSNQYRKFKNGKPVLKRVIESLEILKEQRCSIQFDSCLTDLSIYSLKGLIDLAAEKKANRVYLALIDRLETQGLLDIKLVARKIVEATKYGEEKGVFLGGPWKKAMDGSSNMVEHRNQVPYLVVGPTGEVSFSAYHEKALGQVKNIEEILSSPQYKQSIENWEKLRVTCLGCELEKSCNGYLKSMIMYHTGSSDGYERECQLAREILNELTKSVTTGKGISVSQKLTVSRNLILKRQEKEMIIYHRLAGTAIKSSPNLLEFLDLFKESIYPLSLSEKYMWSDLQATVARLIDIRFLIPEDTDEETQWLEEEIGQDHVKIFQSAHFVTYYPNEEGYFARDYTYLMEEAYCLLTKRGLLQTKNKALILICQSREQFKEFWGVVPLPEWVKAFVSLGRIIVVDQQKFLPKNRKTVWFLQRMAHELVHIFLNELHTHLPVWMEEGVCEYYSRPYDEDRFKILLMRKRIYGFREMEALVRNSLLDLDDSPVKENICYQQAHSFVAYLANLKGEKTLLKCIRDTGLSKDLRSLFQQYYGQSLDEAERQWLKMYPEGNYSKLRTSKNLRIIQNENRALLYNAFYGQSLLANLDLLTLIDHLLQGKTLREIAEEFDVDRLETVIANLHAKGLMVFDNQLEENKAYRTFNRAEIENGALITNLRLNVCNSCNMSCKYCYVDQSTNARMDWPTAQKALNSFFHLQRKHGHTYCLIRFFGGEPLLNWPLIEQVLEYVESLKTKIKINYILNTNGTIMVKEIAKKLADNQVNIAVSLDGVGAVHNRYRKLKSGTGSFTIIDNNLEILLSYGCILSIEATLGNHNYNHLKELIDYISEKGVSHNSQISLALQSMCMVPRQGLDTLPIEKKVKKIIETITYAKERGINIREGMIQFPLNALFGKRGLGVYCRAMGEELCIYPNSDIYPCGALKIKLGTLEDIDSVFRSDTYLRLVQRVTGNIPACRGCEIEAFCAGGCAADAMAMRRDLFQPTENSQFEKTVFKALVEELLLMNAEL
jgi:uncharacterized protein